MRLYILFFLLCIGLLILPSCSKKQVRSDLLNETIGNSKSEKLNYELASKSLQLKKDFSVGDYQIGPEDLLDIDVFQVEELKTSIRVSTRGYIRLPLIGEMKAGGLTVSELEDEISERLEKFLVEPVVTVFVKEYRSQQITVLGAVKNPQVYSVTQQKYLLDMLPMAGGLTENAENECYVQKVLNDGVSKKIYIDLDELLVKGNSVLNIPLSSGDVVFVPRKGIFYIDGAVRKPGSYAIEGKMTLTQAMIMAGGMNFEASASVDIQRHNGSSENEIIKVDYDEIVDNEIPDIILRDKDVIYVHSNPTKMVLGTIGRAIGRIISFGVGWSWGI